MREARRRRIVVGMTYRCLLVDDHERFLRSAGALLRREGVDVVACATSAAEAIAAATRQRVDISLIDVQLGGESGVALARELADRRLGGRILLISALDADDLAGLLAGSPAAGFIAKEQLSLAAIEAAARDGPLRSTPDR